MKLFTSLPHFVVVCFHFRASFSWTDLIWKISMEIFIQYIYFYVYLFHNYWLNLTSLSHHHIFISPQCHLHSIRPTRTRNGHPSLPIRTKCRLVSSMPPWLSVFPFKLSGEYFILFHFFRWFLSSYFSIVISTIFSFSLCPVFSWFVIFYWFEVSFFEYLLLHLVGYHRQYRVIIVNILLSTISISLPFPFSLSFFQIFPPSVWSFEIRLDSVYCFFRCDIFPTLSHQFVCFSPSGMWRTILRSLLHTHDTAFSSAYASGLNIISNYYWSIAIQSHLIRVFLHFLDFRCS